MKNRFLACILLIAPALLYGQDKSTMLAGPVYTEIKAYLSLTDTQIQSLQAIQDSRNQALQVIYNQISQKYNTLNQLLEAGNASAAQVGQLMLDIQALQKQTTSSDGPYRTQSLNVLTADQKAKLPKLTEALQLQPAAGQAGTLLLIDYPQYRLLPAMGLPSAGAGVTNLLGAVSR